jgi:peroxiredoxin
MNAAKTLLILVALASASGCGDKAPPAASVEAPAATPPAAPPQAPPAEKPLAHPEPAAVTASAELGKPAPDFTLTDTEGKAVSLSALRGKTVVLEWFNPDCPFVKYAHSEGELKTMASKVMGDSLVWLSINSGAPGKQGHGVERNRAAKTEYGITNTILLDEAGSVGRTYGAEKTPHLFVIDAKGALIYRGAVDNAPIGKVDPERARLPSSKEQELVNYVSAALEDMQGARALRIAETPAYGCSVKYQS